MDRKLSWVLRGISTCGLATWLHTLPHGTPPVQFFSRSHIKKGKKKQVTIFFQPVDLSLACGTM